MVSFLIYLNTVPVFLKLGVEFSFVDEVRK